MKAAAAEHGLEALIAPVRTTLKSVYPLTPMDRYVQWRRGDGSPFDPWMRVYWREGATIPHIAARSMVIRGTVTEKGVQDQDRQARHAILGVARRTMR